jgi:hypothetical protein
MVSILDLFSKEELAKFTKDSSGNLKGPCPCCAYGQSNYGGFVIFIDSNTCYCHSSKTSFDFLETIALLKGIISCREGRQSK